MDTHWVVVANHEVARLFQAASRTGPLKEVDSLTDPTARMAVGDLESDAPGRAPGGGASEPKRNAKKQESIRFAKRIAEHVQSARQAGRFSRLHLLVEPNMMGLLRDAMDAPTRALVGHELSTNVATQSPADIRTHLPELL